MAIKHDVDSFLVALVAWVLLPLLALTGFVLAAAGGRRQHRLRVGALGQAAGVALSTVVLTLYVASDDSYRDNGTSRWDAYGAQKLTVVAVFLGVVAITLLCAASALRRRDLAVGGFLISTAAAGLEFVAIFANTLN